MFWPEMPAVLSWGTGAAPGSPAPSCPGWAAFSRMTCSQFWPEVVRMGVAVRRCSQLLCTLPGPTLTPSTYTPTVAVTAYEANVASPVTAALYKLSPAVSSVEAYRVSCKQSLAVQCYGVSVSGCEVSAELCAYAKYLQTKQE